MVDVGFEQENIIRQMAIRRLIGHLDSIYPVSDTFATLLLSVCECNSYASRKHISSPLNKIKNFYFLDAGVAQVIVKYDSGESVIRLIDQNMTVLHELLSDRPCYLQAIGPVEVVSVPAIHIEQILESDRSARQIWNFLIKRELNEIELSCGINRIRPVSKRLKHFRDTHPQFEDRIPLKYIASYLNMALETLIRLRNSYNSSDT